MEMKLCGSPYHVLIVLLLACIAPRLAQGWGWAAHARATLTATERVPGKLGAFYQIKAHADFLHCYCVLPDSWWGNANLLNQLPAGLENPAGVTGGHELHHHFIDLDEAPYSTSAGEGIRIPRLTRAQARALFARFSQSDDGRRELERASRAPRDSFDITRPDATDVWFANSGEVPWVIVDRYDDLVKAFREGNWARALFISALVAHYAEDANVPLHTAHDYDGWGQKNKLLGGIHARWESGLVERNSAEFEAACKERLKSQVWAPLSEADMAVVIWDTVNHSHALLKPMLEHDDAILSRMYPERVALEKPPRNENRSSYYTDEYYKQLYAAEGAAVRDQVWRSADLVARIWELAWRTAGSPELPTTAQNLPALKTIDYLRRKVNDFDPAKGHYLEPLAPRTMTLLGVDPENAVAVSDHGHTDEHELGL
jgi:hypothetical protein